MSQHPMDLGQAAWPLSIYYDASCPLCRTEMHALKDYDRLDRLRLVDCSGPGFDDAEVARAGIAVADMMRRIHARDSEGRWFIGIDVFVLAYGAAGIEGIARLWSQPRLRPLWDRLYPWVATHRAALSRLGLDRAFNALVRGAARRAAARDRSCRDGACRLV